MLCPDGQVETVAVLQSLEGQAVFECEWCGHVTLVRMQEPLRSACWLGSMPAGCKVSFAAFVRESKELDLWIAR
jgi:hypothetical protein